MSKYLLLIVVLFMSTLLHAQDKNSQSVALYLQAEESYSSGNFKQSVAQLNEALSLLDSPNSKLLYLKIRALDEIYPQSYAYTKDLDTSLTIFFRVTNRASYPEQKYLDVLKVNSKIEDFKKSDQEYYNKTDLTFQKKTMTIDQINSDISGYLSANPNTYYSSKFKVIQSEINDINNTKAKRVEKKDVFNAKKGLVGVLSVGYGVPLGSQKEAFVSPRTYVDVENFLNGKSPAVGAKLMLNANLFELCFPIVTTPSFRFSINWTIFEFDYMKWNWDSNYVYYKTGDSYGSSSSSNKIKSMNVLRYGTKVGPTFSTGISKNKIIVDIYYNFRPGYFSSLDNMSFDLADGSTMNITRKSGFSEDDIDFGSEFGVKFRFKGFYINPYYVFGNYKYSMQIADPKGTLEAQNYKMKIPYSFVGVCIGF